MSWLDVVFPTDCAGCGLPGALACARCVSALSGPASLTWPSPSPPGLPPPWSVTAYAGPGRDLLLAYKERGAVGLRSTLATPLAAAIRAAALSGGAERFVVVPAPSAARSVRVRGDDVVLTLARRAASMLRHEGLSIRVVPALRQGRQVADSAGLSSSQRAANLAGALQIRRARAAALRGARVVIADDLITTGATVAEAARELRDSGAIVVGAAMIAATRRHREQDNRARCPIGLRSGEQVVG